MDKYLENITKYFKQSLIDADLNCPEDEEILPLLKDSYSKEALKKKFVLIDNDFWHTGRLSETLTAQIFHKKQPKDKPEISEVELIVIPRIDLYNSETADKRKVLTSLLAFVRLKRNGDLTPSDKQPWIPRRWLSPNESHDEAIANVEAVNSFFTHNPFEAIETWREFTCYCNKLLGTITGAEYTEDSSLFALNLLAGYELYNEQKSILQIDLEAKNTSPHIRKALEVLLNSKMPPLYAKFCRPTPVSTRQYIGLTENSIYSKKHIGQMTGEFPLAPKQRNALHHLFQNQEGDILAVNGPPGTGKTTLLRTVVANMWTQAAIEQTEPPLIVACSNNNQAVTNILDSFAVINEDGVDEALKGRWLPKINSYGLYCCSYSKANNKKYPFYYAKKDDIMEAMQASDSDEMKQRFLDKFNDWNKAKFNDIEAAKEVLHKQLVDTQEVIRKGIDLKEEWLKRTAEIVNEKGDLKYWKDALKQVECLWDSRGFLTKLFMWLALISKSEYRRTKRLLNELAIQLADYSDDQVVLILEEKIKIFHEYEKAYKKMCDWLSAYSINKTINTDKVSDEVEKVLDANLRFKAFKLATHYWEARWLIEMQSFNPDDDKKSPRKVLRKYKRFAKLSPCFVSTFYMIPAVFMAGEHRDNVWCDSPLFNAIDLLIIDESGQATPEVAAVSFALAKQALVVGDIDQIEPVWSMHAALDRANLKAFDLFKDESNYEDIWLESGLLSSSGNVMKVAQNQCTVHQFAALQRGLYLTEHRRCYNEIIKYCNELVYDGVLESLRGSPKAPVPWGTMTLISINATSQQYNGSRRNKDEAVMIAQWLLAQQQNIINYAKNNYPNWSTKTNSEILTAAVGIISPFKAQANLITAELKKQSIEDITVGTVHSLQGAERLIILFSSVYGSNDLNSGKFYDKGKNMLNVAVSRAKDSFIVFGNPNFGISKGNVVPSGVLRKHLTNIENQEL